MAGKLSQYLFEKKMRKQARLVRANKMFVPYQKARSVLLLFQSDYTEKNYETKQIIDGMIADGKKVVAVGYLDKKEIKSPAYPEYRILHKKDITPFQKPKKKSIKEFMPIEFDLLINISYTRLLPLEYLALLANAKCKTGLLKGQEQVYDFALDIDHYLQTAEIDISELEYSFLYKQILFYLKNIQTKDK